MYQFIQPLFIGVLKALVFDRIDQQLVTLAKHDLVLARVLQGVAASSHHQTILVPDRKGQRLADADVIESKADASHGRSKMKIWRA